MNIITDRETIKSSAASDLVKTGPCMEIKADTIKESGEFEGYGSTFGGKPDSYGDIIAVGAFANSLAAHKAAGTMPKLFWQHDVSKPIGKWLEAKEDNKGLFLKGKLNMDVQQAREAYSHLKKATSTDCRSATGSRITRSIPTLASGRSKNST